MNLYTSHLTKGKSILEDYSKYRLRFINDTDYTLNERNGNSVTGKWRLASNDTKIILDEGTVNEQYSI
jgi:hypothetical protein